MLFRKIAQAIRVRFLLCRLLIGKCTFLENIWTNMDTNDILRAIIKSQKNIIGPFAVVLAKILTEKPTLVLLDIMMPKMNGLQVLEKVKADPATKSIPIIMLTNLAGQQDAEAALSKGAVKYIIKSEHDPKQVSEMVKDILAGYTRNEVPTVHVEASPTAQPISEPVSQVAPPETSLQAPQQVVEAISQVPVQQPQAPQPQLPVSAPVQPTPTPSTPEPQKPTS